jgi:hypothetical protein
VWLLGVMGISSFPGRMGQGVRGGHPSVHVCGAVRPEWAPQRLRLFSPFLLFLSLRPRCCPVPSWALARAGPVSHPSLLRIPFGGRWPSKVQSEGVALCLGPELPGQGDEATGQCRHCGGRFFFFHLKAPPAFSPSPPSNPQTSAARTALGEIPTRVGGSPPRTSGTLSGTTSSGEGVGRAADPAKPARPSFCWVGVTPAGHQEWHKRCKPLRIRSRLRGEMENYGGWPRPCGWSKNHPPEVDIEGDRGRPA